MSANTLCFRNGEQCYYFTEKPVNTGLLGEVYQVCLWPIDNVPSPWFSSHDVQPYTVLCTAQYSASQGQWSWVALEPDTKDSIGEELERLVAAGDIEEKQWLWMVVEPAYLRTEAD